MGVFSGLRFKFALVLALFSGFLMLSVMILLEQNIRASLIRESIEKGIGIARGIAFNAEDPLLTGDDLTLFSAVKNALRSPGIRYALIVDRQNRIRAAADMALIGKEFRGTESAQPVETGENYRLLRTDTSGGSILDLQVGIFSIAEQPVRLGEIHLGLSEEVILHEVRVMRDRLAALSLAALVGASLLAYLLAGFFIRPVRALVRGVKAIGEGNFDQHIDLQRKDELGILTSAFNDMATSLQEKKFLQSTFERYVSKPLSQQILKHKDELKLGGEEKEVTILFSDIRRFTALAEQLPPALVVELLNDYFTRVIAVVMQNEGMVDKLMGDSVMALFGAPISLGNDSLRAVRCALEMQQAVEVFNRERSARNLPPVEMGIGINTGPVIAGNIGSAARMEYTVIGDSVNIAARLQGLARPGEILISQASYLQVRDRVKATAMETMALKGKTLTVDVYRLEGLR